MFEQWLVLVIVVAEIVIYGVVLSHAIDRRHREERIFREKVLSFLKTILYTLQEGDPSDD